MTVDRQRPVPEGTHVNTKRVKLHGTHAHVILRKHLDDHRVKTSDASSYLASRRRSLKRNGTNYKNKNVSKTTTQNKISQNKEPATRAKNKKQRARKRSQKNRARTKGARTNRQNKKEAKQSGRKGCRKIRQQHEATT